MSDTNQTPGWGINFTQAWAAVTVLLFAVLLVVVTRCQTERTTHARGLKMTVDVYQITESGPRRAPEDGRMPVGTKTPIRVTLRDEGHLIVFVLDDAGHAVPVYPDSLLSNGLPSGYVDIDDAVEVSRGKTTLTAVFCESRFVIEAETPQRPFGCEEKSVVLIGEAPE